MSETAGFWSRQGTPPATRGQILFDVVFGIVLPIACILSDPIVFRSGHGPGMIFPFPAFAYAFIGLEALLLAGFLAVPRKAVLFS